MTTSEHTLACPVIGGASQKGPGRPRNADAYDSHIWRDRLGVSVVDGTGSDIEVALFAQHAAYHSCRVAARQFPAHGIVSVTSAVADPISGLGEPDGAIIVLKAEPGQPFEIAWAGDCAAWAWNGTTARRVTTPHTLGEQMRARGAEEAEARKHDNMLLHGIGRATMDTVPRIAVRARAVVLVSDGITLPAQQMTDILGEHISDPTKCAEQILSAARDAGSVDDATVVVVLNPSTTSESADA